MAFQEDLSIFFEDFGIEFSFSRGLIPLATSTMILNAPISHINVYDRSFYDEKFYEASVQGQSVELLGTHAELTALTVNDTTTINTETWYVIAIEPDGTGLVTLRLSLDKA